MNKKIEIIKRHIQNGKFDQIIQVLDEITIEYNNLKNNIYEVSNERDDFEKEVDDLNDDIYRLKDEINNLENNIYELEDDGIEVNTVYDQLKKEEIIKIYNRNTLAQLEKI